jgi:serine/threonine protein kinase
LLNEDGPHLAWPRALSLARQVLYALAYAHERGIVHRDLKPANLIVQTLPQQPEHVKVLDFGFAKFLPGSELDLGAQLTRAGHTFGSPPYMSPEHATGSPVDGRSDLYSVGIMLFEMLTGKRPFDGEIHEVLRHHLSTPVPRLADRRPELSAHPELQSLIDRALAKQRDQRFADAGEFLRALDAVEAAAQAIDAQVTLVVAPRTPAPSAGEVGRLLSSFAVGQLMQLRKRGLPRMIAWSGARWRGAAALLQRLLRRA